MEPFVGGGAVFFYIAQTYETIKRFYLLDINQDLINCYNAIKKDVDSLIEKLWTLQAEFDRKTQAGRKKMYYRIRDEFNRDRQCAKLIFLNKTCFNGLYRVNRKDLFNVPFGDYKRPTICNEENLRAVARLLKKAKVICGDFEQSRRHIDSQTFVYLDPPYRPLNATASFTSYSKNSFSEEEQERLARFCREIDERNAKFLLSNSDPKNEDPNDHFFEDHYQPPFEIERVKASRAINCKAAGRGRISELIITNY